MENLNNLARDSNGAILKLKDLVFLTGEEPRNPVVSYVTEMITMLNNKKQYIIDDIHKHDNNKYSVRIGGWNWDCRNVTKIIKDDVPLKVSDPEIFNPENLDI